jgi:hypothetical protein
MIVFSIETDNYQSFISKYKSKYGENIRKCFGIIGRYNANSNLCVACKRAKAIGWFGIRTPTESWPPVIKFWANFPRFKINVIGPGQKSRAKAIA